MTCQVEGCEKPKKKRSGYCSMHAARVCRHGSPDGKARRKTTWERVSPRIERGADCWTWDGYHDGYGYAVLRNGSTNLRLHRLVYEQMVGPIGDGLVLDHACRNRACVNPEHLRPVTIKQNVEHFTTHIRANNTSGYRGVSFHKASGLWTARVKASGVERVTYHKNKEDAAEAARKMRLEMHTHNDLDRVA